MNFCSFCQINGTENLWHSRLILLFIETFSAEPFITDSQIVLADVVSSDVWKPKKTRSTEVAFVNQLETFPWSFMPEYCGRVLLFFNFREHVSVSDLEFEKRTHFSSFLQRVR